MKLTIKIIFFLILLSLMSFKKQSKKEIKVEVNYNVETLGLVYSLADSELVYSSFKGKAHLLKYFLKKFEKYKEHPAVIKMKELKEKEIFNFWNVTTGLYYSQFPEFNKKYKYDSNYTKNEIKELNDLFQLIRKFYIDADLQNFFKKEETLYSKIKKEIISVLPDSGYINALEEFYGVSMADYVIVPSIFIPNYFNFGPRIISEKGIICYFVLGPAYDIEIKKKINLNNDLGFNDKKTISLTGVHEFGHTFMRFIDKTKNNKLIESISYLNTKDLQNKIYPQGYGTWKGVFEEHLVRACEIAIAKKIGKNKLAKKLYKDYVNKRGFIYIKKILEIIPDYEKNRNKYKKFEDFFPEIINTLKNT